MSRHLYYETRDVTPAKLQNKNWIMVVRACPGKRYHLAIVALKYILKEIPDYNLTIVSECNKDLINVFLFIFNYLKINK